MLSAITFFSGSANQAAADDPPPTPGFETALAHDLALRAQLGLSQDPSFVAALRADGLTVEPGSRDIYDMPLTPDEATEMRRRAVVDAIGARVESTLSTFAGDRYASHRIDNQAGGTLVIQVTGDVSALATPTAALMQDHPFKLEKVRFGSRTLETTREAIWRLARQTSALRLHAVGADLQRNGLKLYLSATPSEALSKLISVTAGPVPVALVVEGRDQDVGVIRADLPYRGGVVIDNTGTPRNCTSGFTGYRNTVPTQYFILTAGHCGRPYEEFGQETFSGVTTGYGRIGLMDYSGYHPYSYADAARIRITDATKKSNRIIIGPNITREITSSAPVGSYGNGSFACLSTTQYQDTDGDYYNCGIVEDGSYDSQRYDEYYDRYFSGLTERLGSYRCIPGDSGGPVIDHMTAVGTITAKKDDGRCIFAHIHDALTETGVHGIWPG